MSLSVLSELQRHLRPRTAARCQTFVLGAVAIGAAGLGTSLVHASTSPTAAPTRAIMASAGAEALRAVYRRAPAEALTEPAFPESWPVPAATI